MSKKVILAWTLLAITPMARTQTTAPVREQNVQEAPGQKAPPAAEDPAVPQSVPQTQPNRTSMDMRQIKPMADQPSTPDAPSPAIRGAENTNARPAAEAPHLPDMRLLNFIG